MKKSTLVIMGIVATVLFSGCATKSSKIPPVPVSEATLIEYKALTCDQLKDSYRQQETKNQITAMRQDEIAKSDSVLIGWGWMLYGLPYFWLDGDGLIRKQYEVDLGKLYGMEEAMKAKGCIAK